MRALLCAAILLTGVVAQAAPVVVDSVVPLYSRYTQVTAHLVGEVSLRIFVESNTKGSTEQCTFPTSAVTAGSETISCPLILAVPDDLSVWVQSMDGVWNGPAEVFVPADFYSPTTTTWVPVESTTSTTLGGVTPSCLGRRAKCTSDAQCCSGVCSTRGRCRR